MGLALRLTFHRAAEILGITTDDVRSLVVEMPRRLPAIYVTQVGHAEPYEWQLLRVDSAGNAFDMSIGGIDGAVHTGFLRIESAALEKFIRDNDLPARHETEFAPHPATEPGAPVPKPQAAAPALAKPLQRSSAQDSMILTAILKAGHTPLSLPVNEPGKAGVKAEIRNALRNEKLFTGSTVFDKAWERLRKQGDIADTDQPHPR